MSDLPCPCGLKLIDTCDCRYPYRHHGPAVHGSKMADYLISEANLREDRPELFDDPAALTKETTDD